MTICKLILAIYVFVQVGTTTMAEYLQSSRKDKQGRSQYSRKRISEVMQDGQIIRPEVRDKLIRRQYLPEQMVEVTPNGLVVQLEARTGSKARKRIIRKSKHSQHSASDRRLEHITNDGRLLPTSSWTFNASLNDTAVTTGYDREMCCLLGSTCNQCPTGLRKDEHGCGFQGKFRCRYKNEHDRNPGTCCQRGSSCRYCPSGHERDNACCHSGCHRCKPAMLQIDKAGKCCGFSLLDGAQSNLDGSVSSKGKKRAFASCATCPFGSLSDTRVCRGKGNRRCSNGDDCWPGCGWNGYCSMCFKPGKENRACCKKGVRSPICSIIPEDKKRTDRHTCVDVPISSNTWVPRIRYTLVERKSMALNIKRNASWSWLSWAQKHVKINISYGPGILTGFNLKRARIGIDGPYVVIELTGVVLNVSFKGSFNLFGIGTTGTIDVGSPASGGELMMKFRLPDSNTHKDKRGNFIIGIEEVVDTIEFQVGVRLGKYPRVVFGKRINVVKDAVRRGLVLLGRALLGAVVTAAVDELDARKPKSLIRRDAVAALRVSQFEGTLSGKGRRRRCFELCGKAAGWCLACPKGFACCHAGQKSPPECKTAEIKSPKGYSCAKVPSGEPFLGSLRFYVPDQSKKIKWRTFHIYRMSIGLIDLSRIRVDITADAIFFSYENIIASAHATFSRRRSTTLYANVKPGGHGAVKFNVEVNPDGKLGKIALRDCRLFVDITLKINRWLLGWIVDIFMARMKSFIAKKIQEAICGLLKKLPQKAAEKWRSVLASHAQA